MDANSTSDTSAAVPPGIAAESPAWRRAAALLLPPLLWSAVCLLGMEANYLMFHVLAELTSIVVALTALVVASTSYRFTRNHFVIYIAVAIGWCAALDLYHTLVFKGMGLLAANSANPATQLWIAARLLQALALLSAPLLLRRQVGIGLMHLLYGALALSLGLLVTFGYFPTAYVDGVGLTAFKIYTEYVIILILAAALWQLWRLRHLLDHDLRVSLSLAMAAMILSEFAFTQYVSVYGSANLVGHLLKIFAYWFVYVSLVQNTLRQPFNQLARAASTYDAVPDPTLIVDADGSIRQANRAAAAAVGQPAEALVGQSSHRLFHDADTGVTDCPVCQRLRQAAPAFALEMDTLHGTRAVECSVAPFTSGFAGAQTYVQVVRDISERRRLSKERMTLISALGERIKELRCLYAIAHLGDSGDITPATLLRETAALLPQSFLHPQHAHVSIESDWGRFGAVLADSSRHLLVRTVTVYARPVATLVVAYPDDGETRAFLPEEEQMMDAVVRHLGETIERILGAQKVARLSYLYEMLSATNRAIVHCRTEDELLATVFEALGAHSRFKMRFIARRREGNALQVTHSAGIDVIHLPLLDEVLTDAQSPIAQAIAGLKETRVFNVSLPTHGENRAWLDYLRNAGITRRALVPMLRGGKLFGVIGLYGCGEEPFDEDELRLLDEMSLDLSFALDTQLSEQRLSLAEVQASRAELRFREVFEASPVAMQIMSLDRNRVVAINRAHQRLLGYTLDEIADGERWFTLAYPDPVLREQLRASWQEAIETARGGGADVNSPEILIRCKDGSERTVSGSMTLLGDEAVVVWTDLTEIRRQQAALRESEQRFRGMIEQNLTGIYVRLGDRFAYVNPRLCEMLGYPAEALLNRPILETVRVDEASLAKVKKTWAELDANPQSSSYTVGIYRSDGSLMQLGIHGTPIVWNGQPAFIAMVQDVTERQHAEEQIQRYVQQLEASMYGTLHAVSNMVDLRDPYTAGHERRVGLIAAAIAREMGWSEERCRAMEMIGLVHDIGKIAVPAELLSKPTRLSELEMQMIRQHAQAGYEILKDVSFPYPVAEIIRQHHERMDGSGYPQGLKGEAILPEARLLAVADVLESMSSHRPYRPAVGLEAAVREIEAGSGTLFDPPTVAAALRLVRDKGYTLPQ